LLLEEERRPLWQRLLRRRRRLPQGVGP
jgi:hypothetical protein